MPSIQGDALLVGAVREKGGCLRTLKASAPSVISIDWPAGMFSKVCVFWLVGQVTESRATERASPRPIIWTKGLPPKLPLLPTVR